MRAVGGMGVLGDDIYLTCGVGKMPSTLSWHWTGLARPMGAPERLLSATYLFKEKPGMACPSLVVLSEQQGVLCKKQRQ